MKIKSTETIKITTNTGIEPALPNQVVVELDNGVKTKLNVVWEESNHDQYDQAGEYEVKGELKLLDYPNPLVEQRADPFIYKHTDSYYYFTGSYPEYDRIVLRRSKTFIGLKESEEDVIWHKNDKRIIYSHM